MFNTCVKVLLVAVLPRYCRRKEVPMAEKTQKKAPAKKTAAKKSTGSKAQAKKTTSKTKAAPKVETVAKNDDVLDQVIDKAKGAAYTAVGFGIMATAKAQSTVRDVRDAIQKGAAGDLVDRVTDGADQITDTVVDSVRKADTHVEAVIAQFEKRIEAYEEQLPGRTAELVKRARTTGQEARGKVRARVFAS